MSTIDQLKHELDQERGANEQLQEQRKETLGYVRELEDKWHAEWVRGKSLEQAVSDQKREIEQLKLEQHAQCAKLREYYELIIATQHSEIEGLQLEQSEARAKLREYDELIAKIHELTAVRMLIPDRDIAPVLQTTATTTAANSGAIPITLQEFRRQVRWVYPHVAEHETGYRADDDTRNVLIYPGGLVIESKATGFYVELFGESEESADLASLEEKLYRGAIEQGVLKEVQNG